MRVYPEIRTIFVEGATDRRLLVAFIGDVDKTDVKTSDDVEGRDKSVFASHGNRGKLISLANLVELNAISNCKLLIDRDYFEFLSDIFRCHCLAYTDNANLIAGYIHCDFIKSFLMRGFGSEFTKDNWRDMVDDLQFSFCLRFAQIWHQITSSSMDFYAAAQFRNGRLEIDRKKLVKKYLSSQDKMSKDVLESVEYYLLLCRKRDLIFV